MTKVIGPLFSLSASGTYRNSIQFNARNGMTFVRAPRIPIKNRSLGQVSHASSVSDMAKSWSLLSSSVKAQWGLCGVPDGLSGYQVYWREWFIQFSDTNNPPVKPC
jgi:hypothetical protein